MGATEQNLPILNMAEPNTKWDELVKQKSQKPASESHHHRTLEEKYQEIQHAQKDQKTTKIVQETMIFSSKRPTGGSDVMEFSEGTDSLCSAIKKKKMPPR